MTHTEQIDNQHKIDWLSVGERFTKGKENRIKQSALTVEWKEIPADGTPLTLPFLSGDSIKTMIREFEMPNVSHVGLSDAMAPNGLIAARAHYKSQEVEVYAIDTGTHVIPLCCFVTQRGHQRLAEILKTEEN